MSRVHSSYSGRESLTGARAGSHGARARAGRRRDREWARDARLGRRAARLAARRERALSRGAPTLLCRLLGCAVGVVRSSAWLVEVRCPRCGASTDVDALRRAVTSG